MIRLMPMRLVIALGIALATSAAHSSAESNATEVVLALSGQGFRYAGYYVALEKGYFKEVGLKVKLQESSNPVATVVKGEALFGVAGSEALVYHASGLPVLSVATIFQHSPAAILARTSVLTDLAQLSGKSMLQDGEHPEVDAFLKAQKIAPTVVDDRAPSQKFTLGEADGVSVRTIRERMDIMNVGQPVVMFTPRTFGMNFYGDVLIAHAQRADRETIAAFRQAVVKGWHQALSHPAETVDLILKTHMPNEQRGLLLQEAAEVAQLVKADLVEVGHQDTQRWTQIGKMFLDAGFIKTAPSVETFLYQPDQPLLPEWIVQAAPVGIPALLIVGFFVFRTRNLSRQLALSKEEVQRARVALKEQELLDSVTDLYNRRYFNPTLEREIVRARRRKVKMSLMMVDVDILRSVNDRWGRAGADAALKAVAVALKVLLREEDIICRYENAEIVALMPDMSPDMARARAETLREQIAQTPITIEDKQFNITLSVGVSLWPDCAATGASLLKSARNALHTAKAMGRDRVMVAK